MRDPKRIDRILDLIKELWKEERSRDQRFGQFMINHLLVKDDIELWGREDNLTEDILNAWKRKMDKAKKEKGNKDKKR